MPFFMDGMSQMSGYGFDDYYGAVDNDAKINPTQRKEISRYICYLHHEKSKEKRERYHHHHCNGGTQAPHKQKKDDYNNGDALEHRFTDGLERAVNKVFPVIGNQHIYALGKKTAVQFIDLFLDIDQHFRRV